MQMSLRHLEIVNRENVNARPGKLKELHSKILPTVKTSRPALGDVGNKIHVQANDPGKQNVSTIAAKNVVAKKAAVKKVVPSVTNETIKSNVVKTTKNNNNISKPEKKNVDEDRSSHKIKEISYSSNRLEAVQVAKKEKLIHSW